MFRPMELLKVMVDVLNMPKEKCPNCKGQGGHDNPVLWKGLGGGEYLECESCKAMAEKLQMEQLFEKIKAIEKKISLNFKRIQVSKKQIKILEIRLKETMEL